jgi:signal transduction histidine kinase
VRFTVHSSGDARGLSDEERFTLFQIVRELLANAVKHASARSVSVLLSCGAADVSVVVQDDGVGFDTNAGKGAAAANSFGLFSIRERLKRHGGTLRILSERGAGAQVTAWLPRDKRRGGHDPG